MPLIDDMQRYALECMRLAEMTDDREIRERLLEMAREWRALAAGNGLSAEPDTPPQSRLRP